MSLPDIEEFLTDEPLYAKVSIGGEDLEWLNNLQSGDLRVDGYCPSCKKASTFQSKEPGQDLEAHISPTLTRDRRYDVFKGYFREFSRAFECARNDKHIGGYEFIIQDRGEDDAIVKIGQYPSPVDLQQLRNNEYREKIKEILGSEKAKEYDRAIMAYSHGFGIGAFVYLRRIFESLVLDTYERNKENIDVGEEKFKQKKMKEKVTILKEFLPDIVNKNKHLYAVLSKGVHELGKAECLDYFTVVRGIIEYIIGEVHSELKGEDKRAELEKQLNEIHSDTSNST